MINLSIIYWLLITKEEFCLLLLCNKTNKNNYKQQQSAAPASYSKIPDENHPINVWLKFEWEMVNSHEWEMANSQSAHTNNTLLFYHQFYTTVQNRSLTKGASMTQDDCTWVRKKNKCPGKLFKHVGAVTLLSDLRSVGRAFSILIPATHQPRDHLCFMTARAHICRWFFQCSTLMHPFSLQPFLTNDNFFFLIHFFLMGDAPLFRSSIIKKDNNDEYGNAYPSQFPLCCPFLCRHSECRKGPKHRSPN